MEYIIFIRLRDVSEQKKGNKMNLRTIDYGTLPIAKKSDNLNDRIIDTIEGSDGSFYEVRTTVYGALVALECK